MKHVLVVDDEPYFAQNIMQILDPNEFQISTAANGEEGLEEIKKQMPELILLDIKMPKMDGITFLKIINHDYGQARIPVIITSNLSTMDKISEGLALGIKGYILKSDETLESITDAVKNFFTKK